MAIECILCTKSIGRYQDYITCTGECKSNFHIACVNITVEVLTAMKESNEAKIWKCTTCRGYESSNVENSVLDENITGTQVIAFLKEMEIRIIKELTMNVIVPLKSEINELKKQNVILSKEVEILQSTTQRKSFVHPIDGASDKNIEISNTVLDKQKQAAQKKDNILQSRKKEVVELTKSSDSSIDKKYSSVVKQALVNKTNDNGESNLMNEEFTLVYNKHRKRRESPIMGTALNSSLKGTITFKHFHVYGIAPETSSAEVVSYLQNNKFKDIKCEKMNAKHPNDYTSFKISVPCEQTEEFKRPELWPSGVKINNYYFHEFQRKKMTT